MQMNAVLNTKLPQEGALQIVVELDIGTKVRLVHILQQVITTGDEDTYAKLWGHDMISMDLNLLSMSMLTCIQNWMQILYLPELKLEVIN